MDTLIIRKPDDMHTHFRQGKESLDYVRDAAPWFSRAIAMPNTIPPIVTAEDLEIYRQHLLSAESSLQPLMVFKISGSMKVEEIRKLKKAGAVAGKLYPKGATTNSEDGLDDLTLLKPVFAAMEEENLVLSIHAEDPAVCVLQRERAYLLTVKKIIKEFPRLKIIIEHLSTIEGVAFVTSMPDTVAGTISPVHLYFTIDDLLGSGLNPHAYCKPIVQTLEDREVLRAAAFSGSSKFFFGSDSAPHLKQKKEGSNGAAGIYSSPVAFPLLIQLFEDYGKLDKLENFTSRYGAEFYGLPLNIETLTLERNSWIIPDLYHDVVPMMAGKKLNWKLINGVNKC